MSSASDTRDTIRQRRNSIVDISTLSEADDDHSISLVDSDGMVTGAISYMTLVADIGTILSDEGTNPTMDISGTTPASGAGGTYSTGVTFANILSFNVIVTDADGIGQPPHHGIQDEATEYYFAYLETDGSLGIYLPSTATNVSECSFTAHIVYTS